MLKIAVGYAKGIIAAKERAIAFYNAIEGRKKFEAVETESGFNEVNEEVYVTTIWYTLLPTIEEKEKQEEKHEYIGSEGIDPQDPNWREKLQARNGQAAIDHQQEIQDWESTTERQ